MRNLFCLLAVFISFPLARAAAVVAAADFCCCCCAPRLHPALLFWGREVPKRKSPVASRVGAWTSLRWRGRGRSFICVLAGLLLLCPGLYPLGLEPKDATPHGLFGCLLMFFLWRLVKDAVFCMYSRVGALAASRCSPP